MSRRVRPLSPLPPTSIRGKYALTNLLEREIVDRGRHSAHAAWPFTLLLGLVGPRHVEKLSRLARGGMRQRAAAPQNTPPAPRRTTWSNPNGSTTTEGRGIRKAPVRATATAEHASASGGMAPGGATLPSAAPHTQESITTPAHAPSRRPSLAQQKLQQPEPCSVQPRGP